MLSIEQERLLRRAAAISSRRPARPRDAHYDVDTSTLSWTPVRDERFIDGYRLRTNGDEGTAVISVPKGTTSHQIVHDGLIYLTSYNGRYESPAVVVDGNGGKLPGGGWSTEVNTSGLSFLFLTVLTTDATDFGLRFYALEANFIVTGIPDLTRVWMFIEEAATGDIVFSKAFSYYAGLVKVMGYLAPPGESTDYIVYLVPETTYGTGILHTVDEYGEDFASAHKNVTLEPLEEDTLGAEWTDNVSSWALATIQSSWYKYDANGVLKLYIPEGSFTFTAPDDARFGGIDLVLRIGTLGGYRKLTESATSPLGEIVLDVGPTVQTHYFFARAFDKYGKRNSIRLSTQVPPGTATPVVTASIGDTAGKLDLGKALTTSISNALWIVDNVLGVADEGITTDLIAQFAITKLRLANEPIIDTARIEDAAITTALIQNGAITNALIQDAAITGAKIGTAQIGTAHIIDAAITSAKIGSLAIDKITGWSGATITVSSTLTFSGTGGIAVLVGGISATTVTAQSVTGSFAMKTGPSSPSIDYTLGSGTQATINATEYRIGGVAVIDVNRDATACRRVAASDWVKATNKFVLDAYDGVTSTSVQIVTDIRDNSGTIEKKTRSVDIRGGIITAVGSESSWTAI